MTILYFYKNIDIRRSIEVIQPERQKPKKKQKRVIKKIQRTEELPAVNFALPQLRQEIYVSPLPTAKPVLQPPTVDELIGWMAKTEREIQRQLIDESIRGITDEISLVSDLTLLDQLEKAIQG